MNCVGCGSVYINVSGDPTPSGSAGLEDGQLLGTEPYYDKSIFSQPTGTGKDGFGTSGRNRFRRPPVWNLDFSLFKGFNLGRVRPELRIEVANVLNHTAWGAPNTTFTSPNFMLYSPSNASGTDTTTNTPGPRRVQVGVRVGF